MKAALHPCPEMCNRDDALVEMDYVCTIDGGDEEGRGYTALYQCPVCKTVKVF